MKSILPYICVLFFIQYCSALEIYPPSIDSKTTIQGNKTFLGGFTMNGSTIAFNGTATISTATAPGAAVPNLFMNTDGRIGLGTVTPGAALDVVGRGLFSTGIVANSNLQLGISDGEIRSGSGAVNITIADSSANTIITFVNGTKNIRIAQTTDCNTLTPGAVGEICVMNSAVTPIWVSTGTAAGGFAALALQ